eukprot:4911625-Amphidinium_carterae.1
MRPAYEKKLLRIMNPQESAKQSPCNTITHLRNTVLLTIQPEYHNEHNDDNTINNSTSGNLGDTCRDKSTALFTLDRIYKRTAIRS